MSIKYPSTCASIVEKAEKNLVDASNPTVLFSLAFYEHSFYFREKKGHCNRSEGTFNCDVLGFIQRRVAGVRGEKRDIPNIDSCRNLTRQLAGFQRYVQEVIP
jgi:Asp-tRNA(Asn)/Glu-tRNA(Gln) amidotransferase B subunit